MSACGQVQPGAHSTKCSARCSRRPHGDTVHACECQGGGLIDAGLDAQRDMLEKARAVLRFAIRTHMIRCCMCRATNEGYGYSFESCDLPGSGYRCTDHDACAERVREIVSAHVGLGEVCG